MTNFLKISTTTLFCSICSLVEAGPFGLQFGQSLSELEVTEEGSKPSLRTVPNPHSSFESYHVWASESTGLCAIIALSKSYRDDRYGKKIRSDFQNFSDALSSKYGKAKLINSTGSGGLWKDSDEWVMSIKQNERVFANTWDLDGSQDEIEYIELRVLALRSDTSLMRLMYKSTNFEKCSTEIDKATNSSF